MITENNPIFDRPIYNSYDGIASYDPYTFIMYENNQKTNGTSYEDTDDNQLIYDTLLYSGVRSHEYIHWIQHMGTTVGMFLNLLRYTQQRTTQSFISEMPEKIKSKIRNKRNKNERIVNIDENNNLMVSDIDEINSLIQIWYDHQIIHNMLEISTSQEKVSLPRGQVFGEVLSDTILYACNDMNISSYLGQKQTKKWYNFDEYEIRFLKFYDIRITTKDIIEGAATINELEYLFRAREFIPNEDINYRNKIEEFVKSSLNGRYSNAWDLFLAKVDIKDKNTWKELMPTFSLICDLALNPPLPPIVMDGPPNSSHWRWVEIYPPMRFFKLLDFVDKLGFLNIYSTDNDKKQYIYDICELSNMPCPLLFNNNLEFAKSNKNFEEKLVINPRIMSYYDYILWVQKNFWNLRNEYLSLFSNYSHTIIGNMTKKYAPIIIDMHIGGGSINWSMPLFHLSEDGKIKHSMTRELYDWILPSSMLYHGLFDFMIGTGNIKFPRYPIDIQGDIELINSINNTISKML